MAGNESGGTPHIWQRLAGFLARPATGQPFTDPRAHSWAKEVKSYAGLPAQYRPFFDDRSPGLDSALPYSVLTPTFREGYGRPEPERLLCILEGCVYVLESRGGRLACACYAPEHIQMIEYGVLLLHSWMTVHGLDASGTVQSVTVRFNSVTDHLMAPFLDCLRGPAIGGSAAALEMERAKLDYLAESQYKFRTYGRASLRTGAVVRQIILQPEIRQLRVRLLGLALTRRVSPAHLSLLSNSELITIRDDPSQRWANRSPHGAIWTYIPRTQITGALLTPRADGTQELAVDLHGGHCVRSLFGPELAPRLEALIVELRSQDGVQAQPTAG